MAKQKKAAGKKSVRRKQVKTEQPILKVRDFLFIAGILVLSGSLIYGGVQLKSYFSTAPFFMVQKIRSNIKIEYSLKRQNIFKVDLNEIENNIIKKNPQFKSVNVGRIFPNVIEVVITERQPFFQIEQNGYFSVDKEGVVILGPIPVPSDDIIVHPVFDDSKKIKPGQKILFNHFVETIKVLEQLRGLNNSGEYKIKELKVSSLNNMSFVLDKIEVRIGKGGYEQKIDTLFARVLPQFDHDLDKIEYVDLRFKDYVIGYKK